MYSCFAAVAIELLVLSFFYRFVLTILIVGVVVFKGIRALFCGSNGNNQFLFSSRSDYQSNADQQTVAGVIAGLGSFPFSARD